MRGQWEPGESELYKGFISGSSVAAAQLFHGTLGFPTATMAEVPVSNHWRHGSNRQSMGRGFHVLLVWIWKPWPTSGGNAGHSHPSLDYNREGVYLDPSIAVSASWFPNCQDGSSPNRLLLLFWKSRWEFSPLFQPSKDFMSTLFPFWLKIARLVYVSCKSILSDNGKHSEALNDSPKVWSPG